MANFKKRKTQTIIMEENERCYRVKAVNGKHYLSLYVLDDQTREHCIRNKRLNCCNKELGKINKRNMLFTKYAERFHFCFGVADGSYQQNGKITLPFICQIPCRS
jgi:hypothetical protein